MESKSERNYQCTLVRFNDFKLATLVKIHNLLFLKLSAFFQWNIFNIKYIGCCQLEQTLIFSEVS